MAIYKRGGVYWYDATIDGVRYRANTFQTKPAAAREVEARERRRIKLGEVSRPVPTLRQAADQWFRSRAESRKSVRTIAQRLAIMFRHIDATAPVTAIGTADVEAAVQGRRYEESRPGRVPAPATVNRDMIDTTLRPILTYCREVLELPVRQIAWKAVRLPEPKGRSRAFTAAEIIAWRAALPLWHRPVFDFLRRYGVRLSEAFFPPSAFDAATGALTIRERKNGVPLTFRLVPADARAMSARVGRATAAGICSAWFREMKDGELRPIHPRGFQAASKLALIEVGILDARPVHDLRHHAASELRQVADVALVQLLLGHEDIRSTARYAHANFDHLYEALCHKYGTEDPCDETTSKENNDLDAQCTGT